MAKWCNSFVMVSKPNGTVCLCLEPMKINQACIRPVQRGPTLKIFSQTNRHVLIKIKGARSGYHNLKCDKKSSYLTTFACQFGRYKFTRLPFGIASAGNMFQWPWQNPKACKADMLMTGYQAWLHSFLADQQKAYCKNSVDHCTNKQTTPIKWKYRYSQKYSFSAYRINYSSAQGRWLTVDAWNCT